MKEKRDLYENFHSKLKLAIEKEFYLESSWYVYALLEDRLVSLLRSSGGVGNSGSAKPIKMMGPKLKELKNRSKSNKLLDHNFDHDRINQWKNDRNDLMHAMADGTKSVDDVSKTSYLLATSGAKLLKDVSSAAMRLKKHKDKVS